MSYPSIAVFGGDARQKWLAHTLEAQNLLSAVYAVPDYQPSSPHVTVLEHPAQLSQYTCLAGPVPFCREEQLVLPQTAAPMSLSSFLAFLQPGQCVAGGNFPASFIAQCHDKQVDIYDYMQSSSLTLANAALTAEGMLAVLLTQTPYALQQASILLLGYGRCGMLLAQKLQALGCWVTVCEKDTLRRSLADAQGFATLTPEELPASLPTHRLVVNTVPELLLTAPLLQLLPADAQLFDLASTPGGIAQEAAKKQGLFVQRCPGLPGSTAPQTAGQTLAADLLSNLQIAALPRKG